MGIRKNASGENLALIFDTHAVYWLATNHPRLSKKVTAKLAEEGLGLFISSVTAWEYSDLIACNRLPGAPAMTDVLRDYAFTLVDFPSSAWALAALLPRIHRDPVDRMLIAHAIAADLTLVTADKAMRRYPVKSLW